MVWRLGRRGESSLKLISGSKLALEPAIGVRTDLYPDTITTEVSEERLRLFFSKELQDTG